MISIKRCRHQSCRPGPIPARAVALRPAPLRTAPLGTSQNSLWNANFPGTISLAMRAAPPQSAFEARASGNNSPGERATQPSTRLLWWAALLRFVCGGGVCFAVSLGVLWLATERWKWHYLAALALSWSMGLVLGFFLHRRWTFGTRTTQLRTTRLRDAQLSQLAGEARRYLMINLGQAAVSAALMMVLVSGFGVVPWRASVLVAALLSAATFVLHRNWSFGAHEE